MNEQQSNVVGLEPWLPWPLSAWPWWTKPVRAECLAGLRIAIAGCLLIDILTSYRGNLQVFFGQEGLGGSQMFAYYGAAPKLNWSLLRGLGDPLLGALALSAWTILTGWFALKLYGKLTTKKQLRGATSGWALFWWLVSGLVAVLGIWSRGIKDGAAIASQEKSYSLGQRLLLPWQDDPNLLGLLFWFWVAAILLLFLGYKTRPAAIATWVLSMSFANVNPNIDNAGDTIRGIVLFYLMLCPCGAVWSLDSCLKRRLKPMPGAVYVWPWPLRLLFIQLVFIYFMNGLYKAAGLSWVKGDSLYYVLGDLSLTRFSLAQLPIPILFLQVATWSVLVWELTFPILVLWRWTRGLALLFGVGFHFGIFATMELGGFVPYVLCLYVPLVIEAAWARRTGGRV